MPKEFKNLDILTFALKINASCFPEKKSCQDSRMYDHLSEQGKKAFHLEVTEKDIQFFKFLANHLHQMKLIIKFFRKFAKLTATLGNNAPLSECMKLWQCIQGHLNFHLSSMSISIFSIDNLDALESLQNTVNGMTIARLSLCDLLYCIKLTNKLPLFLQLS
jgi:hypothetical protein